MIPRVVTGVLLLVLAVAGPAAGQTLDPASSEALMTTLKLLLDPALRGAAPDSRASAADRDVRALTGSDELTRQVYELAAQVFSELARTSGGDVQKMVDALERGRSDPASFAATLSPEVRQRLRELSTKIPPPR